MSTPAPIANQVGGHPESILSSPLSASTLIKPASETELAFYTSLGPSLHPDFVGIYTPAFFGTLRLEGKLNQLGAVDKVDNAGEQMMVLENLTHRFLRPNVLDIKLGTQLHDDDATEAKKARMRATAEETTSGTTGVRLTGFQVWNAATSTYASTGKHYGKSLKPEDLPTGIARFFGPHLTPIPPSPPSSSQPKSSTSFISSSPTPASLPPHLLHPVLLTILDRLNELIKLLSTFECRIRGGSILIVMEGDEDALAASIERASARKALRRSSAAFEDEDDEGEDDEDGDESEMSSVSTTDETGDAKPHTLVPVEVRLIDFAHTARAEGRGPDEGVLLGLETTRGLVRGLVERVEGLMEKE